MTTAKLPDLAKTTQPAAPGISQLNNVILAKLVLALCKKLDRDPTVVATDWESVIRAIDINSDLTALFP